MDSDPHVIYGHDFVNCEVEKYKITKILAENHGLLLPDDNIEDVCGAAAHGYRVLLLGSNPILVKTFPIVVVSTLDPTTHRDLPIITLNIINGYLSISATLYSEDARAIVSIRDNEWIVNPNNIMDKSNPDFSTLQITDQYNKMVMDVRYMNANLIRFKGIIRTGSGFAVINDNGIMINGNQRLYGGMSSLCIEALPGQRKGSILQIN